MYGKRDYGHELTPEIFSTYAELEHRQKINTAGASLHKLNLVAGLRAGGRLRELIHREELEENL